MDDGVPVASQINRKRSTLFLGGVLLAVGLAFAPSASNLSSSAWAAPSPTEGLNYVALGDSYAVGLGLPTATGTTAGCKQSTSSYPRQLTSALGLELTDMTCSGATTANVISAPQDTGAGINPVQVSALSASTDIVTLTIGGNDLGFSFIVQNCLAASATGPLIFNAMDNCKSLFTIGEVDTLAAAVAGPVTSSLHATLDMIKLAAPNAMIFVVGYPALMPDNASIPAGGCFTPFTGSAPAFPFTTTDTEYLNGIQTQLDTAMSNVAVAKGATFVPMLSNTLALSPCANNPDAYVSGASFFPDAMHPTSLGAAFMTATAKTAIESAFATVPAISPTSKNFSLAVDTPTSLGFTTTGFPTPSLNYSGSLPNGMTFDAATGVLSGTPDSPGTSSFSITATNLAGAVTENYTVSVNEAPVFSSTAPSSPATVGTPYSFTVTATGFPVPSLVLNGTLPAGLSFSPSTGVISGTPLTAGSFTFTVSASNVAGTITSTAYTIAVEPAGAAPMITSSVPPAAKLGSAYSFKVVASGYPAPTFAVTSGGLPKGLSLDSASGVMSGTPTEAGKFVFSITASNAIDPASTVQYAITVTDPAVVVPGTPGAPVPPALVKTGSAPLIPIGIAGGLALLSGAGLLVTRKLVKH